MPYERIPQAAGRCVPRRRGSRLLQPPRHLLQGHRARGVGEHHRRRLRAGRLDDHAAGREAVPRRREVAVAQGEGSDHGAPPRGDVLEAGDPRGLPQPDLSRRRRVGRRGRRAALLPEGPRAADARRVRADRRPREGADRVLAGAPRTKQAIERRNIVLDRMAQYGFATEGRRREGEGGADHAQPLSRHLPRSHAVLRRARAPLHQRAATATTRCSSERPARSRPPPSRRGKPPRTRTPTSARAIRTSARAGAAPSGGSTARRARRSSRAKAALRHRPAQPGKRYLARRRQGRRREGRGARRRSQAHAAAAQHELGGEVAEPATPRTTRRSTAPTQALKPGYVDVGVARDPHASASTATATCPTSTNPAWVVHDEQKSGTRRTPTSSSSSRCRIRRPTIFTADHHTGYVVAMVGGYDYDRSVFNRAVQACRQPGSTYKPIYYSLGLDQGYGFDTVLNDVPVEIIDPDTGETWTPANLGGTIARRQRHARVRARVLEERPVGRSVPEAAPRRLTQRRACGDGHSRLAARRQEHRAWLRTLGMTKPLRSTTRSRSARRAASSTRWRARSRVFARYGKWWPRPPATRRTGSTSAASSIATATRSRTTRSPEDPELAAGRPLRSRRRDSPASPRRRRSRSAPRSSCSSCSRHEVEFGFANILRATGINAAGKTGTSSATHDNWFIAFTSKFTTLVWMGDDKKERALGKSDAAYMTVVPLWARYMYEAARGYPNPTIPWYVPAGPEPERSRRSQQGRARPAGGPDSGAPSKKKADDTGDRPPV